MESSTLAPDPEGVLDYEKFIHQYQTGLPIVKNAIQNIAE